jgi:hypothetical protein
VQLEVINKVLLRPCIVRFVEFAEYSFINVGKRLAHVLETGVMNVRNQEIVES